LKSTASTALQLIPVLGVGGTIYNTHTLKFCKELGLDSQRVKKLASKLRVLQHSIFLPNFGPLLHNNAIATLEVNFELRKIRKVGG
jgi:hypothetical protein